MDRQQATAPVEAFLHAPVIQRAPAQTPETQAPGTFVPAAPSRILNGLLGAAWAYHIVAIMSYVSTGAPTEAAPPVLYGFAVGLDFVLFFSLLGVITLAVKDSTKTAPLSLAIASGTMLFGALCGLAGHPASTWLADVSFGAVVAAASVAVFARRA